MTRTVEVKIDETGAIRPLDPNVKLPQGRAVLAWPENDGPIPDFLLSFADWFTPEEDEAWASFQLDE